MPPIAVFVALADPTRCRIIEILREGPQPVHQIAAAFDISRPAISRHLGVLKHARLISEKKSGRENRYELHARRLKPVQDWLGKVTPAQQATTKPLTAAKPSPKPPVAVEAPVPMSLATAQPAAPAAIRVPASSQMGFDF
jgi:DNA-binding transcriptional ArsR family regulator